MRCYLNFSEPVSLPLLLFFCHFVAIIVNNVLKHLIFPHAASLLSLVAFLAAFW